MKHKYSDAEDKFIRKNIKGTGNKKLTEIFNCYFGLELGINQIRAYVKNHKLHSGLTGHFEKGHIPFNKGKNTCAKGCEVSWFKKGHIPSNHKPLGTERITVDDYTEVKVAEPNKWQLKQRLIYEKHKGPIKKGYVVVFGDKNKSNLDINNLVLVSRSQLAILNQRKLIQNDADLTRTGVIVADLYLKMGKRKEY